MIIRPGFSNARKTMALFTKHPSNPVMGPGYTVTAIFDSCITRHGDHFKMWCSWRDMNAIAVSDSEDGVSWSAPRIVLERNPKVAWEQDAVNRPHVTCIDGRWFMWYTGQNFEAQTSAIGLAVSSDGHSWERVSLDPVFQAREAWEKRSVMCPFVLHEHGRFRMWYSAGETYEPDAVGLAESADGVTWTRHPNNPVLQPAGGWEADRVAAACIVPYEGAYLAFYIGFSNGFEDAFIGVARSEDGAGGWERHPENPLLGRGSAGSWDDCNVYKPFVLRVGDEWFLWYNASRFSDRREQVGLATAGGRLWPEAH